MMSTSFELKQLLLLFSVFCIMHWVFSGCSALPSLQGKQVLQERSWCVCVCVDWWHEGGQKWWTVTRRL